jgi:hypothetical protein
MPKKWIFLTCVLSLGSVEISQAHPLDSPDIVYIDGTPCNSACQSYMAWSRQVLAGSGHQAPAPVRPRPANGVAHRVTTPRKQVRVARQAVPLPSARVAMVQPADHAAGKPDRSLGKSGAEADSDRTKAVPEPVAPAPAPAQQTTAAPPEPEQKSHNDDVVVVSHSESVPPEDVVKATPAAPDNDNNQASLPAVDAATDLNIQTLREQLTAAAAAPLPDQKADDQKADNGAQSDRPETIEPGEADKAASAPPNDVAELAPTASAAADSDNSTIRRQVTADIVIAEHVMTLRDAEKAASGSPKNSDQLVAVVIARPEINAIADLAGKNVAMDDRFSESSNKVRTAIAAAGALEVQISEGKAKAIDRLIRGEVPAAVLTLLYPETGFPEFAGYKIFRIPLGPGSPTARL